ncbi:MAG: hypothetical protein ISS35_01300 [Kiritimatiellae bacterium]|nr:hypothetical protein [Kiritimatiellia bacterium]
MTSTSKTAIRFLLISTLCISSIAAHAQLPIITGIDPTDTTMRYDVAFAHKKMENRDEHEGIALQGDIAVHDNWRLRLAVEYISLEYRDTRPDTGFKSQKGLSDISAQLLYKAYAKGPNTLAYGLKVSLETASDDELGNGGTLLTPTAMWSRKCENDILIAPVLEWTYASDLDATPYHEKGDVNALSIKTVLAWEPMSPQVSWLLAEPHLAVDFGDEDETTFDLTFEYGLMFTETMAVFARPTMGSNDSDLDWSILIGFRQVLRNWVLFE